MNQMRKDGRPLVTDHPVTAIDLIDFIPRGELNLSEGATVCALRREPVDESWMEPDEGPGEDFDIAEWEA